MDGEEHFVFPHKFFPQGKQLISQFKNKNKWKGLILFLAWQESKIWRWKKLSKLKCTSTICQFLTDKNECEFIQRWQLERTAWLYLPEHWHVCSYIAPGSRRRLGGISEVEAGTEEQCFQWWLTNLAAYLMGPFFSNNYLPLLPRGQLFLKMYVYINTQTHAHMQEHLLINNNELGSVLFYLTCHIRK